MRPPLHLYLRGKTVLLTGATGFLGKVLLERLLRCAPDIELVCLLIRARSDARSPDSAMARFEAEILGSGVFAGLAKAHGEQWGAFVRQKVMPVAGDLSQSGLGLDGRDHAMLTSRIEIIINAAASVTFDAPIDESVLHNTRSVERIAEFARGCRAAALVHVSTAFVAGRRTGTVVEGPLAPDISVDELAAIDETVAGVRHQAAVGGWDEGTTRKRLAQEGMARAKRLGWHDSYTYTKALGEMALARARGRVPTAVVRPTIIESSLRDPEPGWIENLNVGDPIWVEYGRGRMPDFPFGVDTVYDIVPVDFVAHAILAILPRIQESTSIGYYTVGSGALNPVTGSQIYELTYEYFTRHPMRDRRGAPIAARRLTFPTHEEFRQRFADEARRSTTMSRLLYLADLYETYMNGSCVFDTANTQLLLTGLHEQDRAALDFDVRRIEWRSYIQDVHLPGLRRHVLRDGHRGAAICGHA